jgi:hypothetical protein
LKREVHRPHEIAFVGEQDGESEGLLKARLVERFRSSTTLIEAYLVRVRYDRTEDFNVALCLKMDKGIPDVSLVNAAAEEFAKLFSQTQSMDTLFLTPVQCQQVSIVATPFYRRSSHIR